VRHDARRSDLTQSDFPVADEIDTNLTTPAPV